MGVAERGLDCFEPLLVIGREVWFAEAGFSGGEIAIVANGHGLGGCFFGRVPDQRLQRPGALALVGLAEIVGGVPVGAGVVVLLDHFESHLMRAGRLGEMEEWCGSEPARRSEMLRAKRTNEAMRRLAVIHQAPQNAE